MDHRNRLRLLALGTLNLLLTTGSLAQPAGTAWPMWGQNAQHNFRTPFIGQDEPARFRWRHHLPGTAYKAAAIVGSYGQVIYTSDIGTLYATRTDGTYSWTYEMPWAVTSTPALTRNGLVIVPTTDGMIHAVDELFGMAQWIYVAPGETFSTDAVIGADGSIYAVSAEGFLHALNADGSSQWVVDLEAPTPRTTPTLCLQGSIIVATEDPTRPLIMVSAGGDILRTGVVSDGGPVAASPAVDSDGRVFVATLNGSVEAFGPSPGDSWWTPLGGEFLRGLAVGEDIVVVGSTDANLYALDKDTGALLWFENLLGPIEAPPTIDGAGIIYVGALSATVSSYYPDGVLKYEIAEGIFHGPITIGGEGTIYSTIDWSMWGKDEGGVGVLVSTDEEEFARGDTLVVDARIYNDSPDNITADLRVWVEGPDRRVAGSARQYGRLIPALSDIHEDLVSVVLNVEQPLGNYSIHGVLTESFSGDFSARNSKTVTLRP